MKYVDRDGREKILIMYSPNHWYDLFSTKNAANSLLNMYMQNFRNTGKRYRIEVIKIETFDEFKDSLENFNTDKSYKYWNIVYIWHNQWWLSKNLTDDNLSKLRNLDSNNKITLLGCSTFVWEDNNITWSNQIAQKLSNQLNVEVQWSDKPVYFNDGWRTINIIPNSWHITNPWELPIKKESTSLSNLFHKIF